VDGNDATEGGEGAHNGDSLIVEALRDELNSAQVADVASDSDSDPETEVRLAPESMSRVASGSALSTSGFSRASLVCAELRLRRHWV
jgi:hypothetical protein